jgi:UDP-N-acetylmuramate--alanine ligase
MAVAWLNGATEDELKNGVASFKGVYRRFDVHINTAALTYIDDYAHNPTELQASLMSVRKIYPDRRLTAVFQPHLYSRTRDFMDDFAKVLATADDLLLLPVYPARELPIEGVTSDKLAEKCRQYGNKKAEVIQKAALAKRLKELLEDNTPRVIMTLGAGDIDRLVPDLTMQLKKI